MKFHRLKLIRVACRVPIRDCSAVSCSYSYTPHALEPLGLHVFATCIISVVYGVLAGVAGLKVSSASRTTPQKQHRVSPLVPKKKTVHVETEINGQIFF